MEVNNTPNLNNFIPNELLAAFIDGNVSPREAVKVLKAAVEHDEIADILSSSAELDRESENGKFRILAIRMLEEAKPKNFFSLRLEKFLLKRLGYDIHNWNLLETAKANIRLREEENPLQNVGLLLELKGLRTARHYDSEIEDILNYLRNGKLVIAVVDRNELDGKGKKNEVSYLAVCVKAIGENGDLICLDPADGTEFTISGDAFEKAWTGSDRYMVTVDKNEEIYDPKPINVDDISIDFDIEELTDAIAENNHDIWARAQMDEGRTSGSECKDSFKLQTDLLPFSQLPESKKEKYRRQTRDILNMVRKLGYEIRPID